MFRFDEAGAERPEPEGGRSDSAKPERNVRSETEASLLARWPDTYSRGGLTPTRGELAREVTPNGSFEDAVTPLTQEREERLGVGLAARLELQVHLDLV